jgi:hypothetical protein
VGSDKIEQKITGNITISGLVGSEAPGTPALPIASPGPEIISPAIFKGSLGILIISAQGMLDNHSYAFEFELLNPLNGQESPLVQVLGEGSALIPTTPMTKGLYNQAPLLVAGFTDTLISQSTASQFARNDIVVRVVFVKGYSLPQGAVIRIRHLLGSMTPSTDSLVIGCSPVNALEPHASWYGVSSL